MTDFGVSHGMFSLRRYWMDFISKKLLANNSQEKDIVLFSKINELLKNIKSLNFTEGIHLSSVIRDDCLIKHGNRIIVLHSNTKNGSLDSYRIITRIIAEKIYRIHINYRGKNSVIFLWDDVCLCSGSVITIGENGMLYLGRSFKCRNSININLGGINSTVCFGNNCNVGNMSIHAGDENNLEVLIGDCFLAALNLEMRASDGHTIYSLDNPGTAINKPVFGIHVGRHVWAGMNVFLGKDVIIPADCIIGAGSLVTRRAFSPNSVIAGTPATVIKTNVNWDAQNTEKYEQKKR